MNGWWESNINVWFRFMYSQKWNWVASLFPKQNYNVLSTNFHIHVSVSDWYIPMISLLRNHLEYINRLQIHECRNCKRIPGVSFQGIYVSNFWYSVGQAGNYCTWRMHGYFVFKFSRCPKTLILKLVFLFHRRTVAVPLSTADRKKRSCMVTWVATKAKREVSTLWQ